MITDSVVDSGGWSCFVGVSMHKHSQVSKNDIRNTPGFTAEIAIAPCSTKHYMSQYYRIGLVLDF